MFVNFRVFSPFKLRLLSPSPTWCNKICGVFVTSFVFVNFPFFFSYLPSIKFLFIMCSHVSEVCVFGRECRLYKAIRRLS
jgi:hypothetical protein